MKIIMLLICLFSSEVSAQTNDPDEVLALPVSSDQTPISGIISNPRHYLNAPIIIAGCASVINYYNYQFTSAITTHYSIDFTGLTKTMQPNGSLTVYAKRSLAAPLVRKLVKVQDQSGQTAVRLMVAVTQRCFDDGDFNNCVELLDWQFLSRKTGQWEEWANKPKPPPPPRQITAAEIERIEKGRSEARSHVLKWHQELAEKGDAYGQYKMGMRYITGDEVEKNPAKGRALLELSAAQGYADAKDQISTTKNPTTPATTK